jgi:hypothetical protein
MAVVLLATEWPLVVERARDAQALIKAGTPAQVSNIKMIGSRVAAAQGRHGLRVPSPPWKDG